MMESWIGFAGSGCFATEMMYFNPLPLIIINLNMQLSSTTSFCSVVCN